MSTFDNFFLLLFCTWSSHFELAYLMGIFYISQSSKLMYKIWVRNHSLKWSKQEVNVLEKGIHWFEPCMLRSESSLFIKAFFLYESYSSFIHVHSMWRCTKLKIYCMLFENKFGCNQITHLCTTICQTHGFVQCRILGI